MTDWNQAATIITAIGTAGLALFAFFSFKGVKEQMDLLNKQAVSMKRQADANEAQSNFIKDQSDAMTKQAEIMKNQLVLNQEQIKQNNENIFITKNKILQESYLKEMDSIIGPLKSKIGNYQYYEPIHVTPENEKEASLFWENIKKNKYLVPKDLRDLIERYLMVIDVQKKEIQMTRYKINELIRHGEATDKASLSKKDLSAFKIIDMSCIGPAPVNEGFGSYLAKLEEFRKSPNSDLAKEFIYFHDIAQEGYVFRYANNHSVKDTRFDLEEALTNRYNYLENTIEKLRIEIERKPES